MQIVKDEIYVALRNLKMLFILNLCTSWQMSVRLYSSIFVTAVRDACLLARLAKSKVSKDWKDWQD